MSICTQQVDSMYSTYKNNPELLKVSGEKNSTPEFIKDLSKFRDLKNLDKNDTVKIIELIDNYINANKNQKYAFKNFTTNGLSHNLLSFFMLNYITDDEIKDHLFVKHKMKLSDLNNNQKIQFLTYFIGGNLHSLDTYFPTVGENKKIYPDEILIRHKRYNLEHIDDLNKYHIGKINNHSKLTSAYANCLMEAYFRDMKNMNDDKFFKLFLIADIPLNNNYLGKTDFYGRYDKAIPFFSLDLLNEILLQNFKNNFLKDKTLDNAYQNNYSYYITLRRFLSPDNKEIKSHCKFFAEQVKPFLEGIDDNEKLNIFHFYNSSLYTERKNDNFYDDYHFIFIESLNKEDLDIYKQSLDVFINQTKLNSNYADLYDKISNFIELKNERFTLLESIEEAPINTIKKRL